MPDAIVANGFKWSFSIDEDADVEDAVGMLSAVMDKLANHPNIDPMAFQGALMSAMMQAKP